MKARTVILIIVAAAIAVAAIALGPGLWRQMNRETKPAETALPVPEGFQHDPAYDVAGYFMPTTDVQVGQLALNHIAMGAPSDFEAWEAGERDAVFGPVVLQFDDVSSPLVTNELGGEGRERTVRVRPAAYRLFPGEVSFKGAAEGLGEVAFVGRFDQAALANAQNETESGETAVLTGTLQIGDRRFENLGFTYWIGD